MGLVSFHFLQGSIFFSKLPFFFTAIRFTSLLSPPFLRATSPPSAERAWPQPSPKTSLHASSRRGHRRAGQECPSPSRNKSFCGPSGLLRSLFGCTLRFPDSTLRYHPVRPYYIFPKPQNFHLPFILKEKVTCHEVFPLHVSSVGVFIFKETGLKSGSSQK